MSRPHPPYYYKKRSSDAYHWEKTCSKVPVNVETNPDWEISGVAPSGREQCNECKAK